MNCSSSLPAPGDLPRADIVIYDGHCLFCTQQVKRLARWDGNQRLAFVSLHDPWVADQFPDLTMEQMMEQMYVVPYSEPVKDRPRLGGAAALRYLSRRLPRLWIIAPFLHIPATLPLWQWFYQRIARKRYQLAQQSGQQSGQKCDQDGTCHWHYRK